MQTTARQSRLLGPVSAVAVLVFCAALYLLVPPDILRGLTRENGFFEIGSAVGWFLLAAMLAILAIVRRPHRLYALSAVITALLGMRELDFHKLFTTDSILKTNYYFKVSAPLGEKLAGAAVALGIVLLVAYYVVRYGPIFLRRLRGRGSAAITVAFGLGLLAFSKLVDRSVSVLKDDMHVRVTEWQVHLQTAFEEPLEFFLPLIMLLVVWQHVRDAPAPAAAHVPANAK
jgi:hypothetical protein